MRRQDKYKVIMEANQRLEENYLKSKGLITEAKDIKQVVGKIEDKIEDILSPEEIQFLKSQNPETIANVIDNKIDESDDNSGKLKNIIDKIVKNTTIASLIGVPVAMMTQATIAAATGTPGAQGVISGGQNIISPEAILGLAITGVAGLAIRNSDWWIKRFGKNDTNKKVNEGEGLVNEALNKELKEFGPDLQKKLTSLGFKVVLKINQNVHELFQQVVNSNPKDMLALINYYNYSGSELLNVTVHKDNAKYLEKLVSYFNLPKTEYGPNKEIGWYVKNIRNVNPGDIVITGIQGGQVSFYRAGEKDPGRKTLSRMQS